MPKRSIKLDGKTTSLFLEDTFWRELECRATAEGETWPNYLRQLLEETDSTGNRSASVKEALMASLRDDYDRLCGDPGSQSCWLVEQGEERRREVLGGTAITVGSSRGNSIVLRDPQVAPKHLILTFDGERWWVADLNTVQGTRLNGHPVQVAPVPRRGEISLGSCHIIRV
ncbi:FHA domain-containing protein [Pseudomaricurvus alkylphenolicus]|uniref:FHA domain-containing protein n=1 Tax=Pseudomaricurvus alkylphenolicus TaxID=1306991 RepID=UPI00141F185A|nr:FHA domain-containing protein [Pseudomaricurvus alkylphenolicus]NIB40221.1 FHA domain-containing protein [Pseudomaricurvus alkylphenolicus]